MYRSQQILTFYGIRKSESVSRNKYNRIEDDAESVKIQQQTVASPIFFWEGIDIWLYILTEKIDFNSAYRLGYDRVGCWCCPNNNQRAQFLSRVYMPKESKEWRDFLLDFAKKIGKPDPEVYVDSGKWKARQGGNGLESAGDVKIRFTNCTAEYHAKIYRLVRPFDDELVGMFVPFGKLAPELGKKLLREIIILDVKSNVPILSLQPFNQDGYDYAVKIRTMNVANHDDLQRMASYQIRKFNACRKCLKCESICRQGAISIIGDNYYIDSEKCIHCKMCMTAKQNVSGSDLLFKKLPEVFDYHDKFADAARDIIDSKAVFDGLLGELKHHLLTETKNAFLPKGDRATGQKISLVDAVKEWCDQLDPKSFEQLFPDGTDQFLQHLKSVTNDEDLFIIRLAKLTTGLRIEDWDGKTIELYFGSLDRFMKTAKDFHSNVVAKTINETSNYQIIFADESGVSTTRRFDKVNVSGRGKLLFNQITASLDAMGHSISEQEKRQVLMEVLKKLC